MIDDDLDNIITISPLDGEIGYNKDSNEVTLIGAPRVWITTENIPPVYLTREDILELGFLRSNPEKKIYQHKDKPTLYFQQYGLYDYSVKDFAVEISEVMSRKKNELGVVIESALLYRGVKPSKEDIQRIVNNYAG